MFISRTPQDKQPSLSPSVLPLKASAAQVIKIPQFQGDITLCLVAKAKSRKDGSLCCFLSFSYWVLTFLLCLSFRFVQDVFNQLCSQKFLLAS